MEITIMRYLRKYNGFFILMFILTTLFSCKENRKGLGKDIKTVTVFFDERHQTMDNFGASDCWTIQEVGLWEDSLRNQLAKLLFSREMDNNGNPEGIGLSSWRFNIGAGSAAQGEESNISGESRRVECFLNPDGSYDFTKQAGQRWFLQQAAGYEVETLIAFLNSPPIWLTKNGRANCSEKYVPNLSVDRIEEFAEFITEVLERFENQEKVKFDYISPFNEPQWEWLGGQEGTYMDNSTFSLLVRELNEQLIRKEISTHILIPDAATITYLFEGDIEKSGKQIEAFGGNSPYSVNSCQAVAPIACAHSYFTNWPLESMVEERRKLKTAVSEIANLKYWQTEYCILGDHEGIRRAPYDLSMELALYVARLIHLDITEANAAAWQWWLAVTFYDYNDGLIFVDNKERTIHDSKLLWGFGNYSRFIRPGAVRLETHLFPDLSLQEQSNSLMISSYDCPEIKEVVIVAVNMEENEHELELDIKNQKIKQISIYETSEENNLTLIHTGKAGKLYTVPGKSVTTFVCKY